MSVYVDDKDISMAVLSRLLFIYQNLIVTLEAIGNKDRFSHLNFIKVVFYKKKNGL